MSLYPRLFGPVLYYDMVRQARRARFIVVRFVYALALILLLVLVLATTKEAQTFKNSSADTGTKMTVHQGAAIAQKYFEIFVIAQFLAVLLLTPAYVAGAITEEKDRKTLEFILATQLLDREIVLGKLGSRVGNLTMLMLTGLPVLGILQFLGGIDPNLVLGSFAITIVTMLSLAGVSILCSVWGRKTYESITLAYIALFAFYSVAFYVEVWDLRKFGGGWSRQIMDLFDAGNILAVLAALKEAAATGKLAARIPELASDYTVFHAVIAIVCTVAACVRIRSGLSTPGNDALSIAGRPRRFWFRPRVGSHPVYWRETYCNVGNGTAINVALVFTGVVTAGLVVAWQFLPSRLAGFDMRLWRAYLDDSMKGWLHILEVAVGLLMLCSIAIRASTSIVSERENQTLDNVLTTPLGTVSTLTNKWFASFGSGRYGIAVLALIWGMGALFSLMDYQAVPIALATWVIYAAVMTSVGLWMSEQFRSALKARMAALAVLFALILGHAYVWMEWGSPLSSLREITTTRSALHHCVLTPPFMICSFERESRRAFHTLDGHSRWPAVIVTSSAGLAFWSFAAAVFFASTITNFRKRRFFLSNPTAKLLGGWGPFNLLGQNWGPGVPASPHS